MFKLILKDIDFIERAVCQPLRRINEQAFCTPI